MHVNFWMWCWDFYSGLTNLWNFYWDHFKFVAHKYIKSKVFLKTQLITVPFFHVLYFSHMIMNSQQVVKFNGCQHCCEEHNWWVCVDQICIFLTLFHQEWDILHLLILYATEQDLECQRIEIVDLCLPSTEVIEIVYGLKHVVSHVWEHKVLEEQALEHNKQVKYTLVKQLINTTLQGNLFSVTLSFRPNTYKKRLTILYFDAYIHKWQFFCT